MLSVLDTVRNVIAFILVVVAFILFFIPCFISLSIFAVIFVICLAILALGCVMGGFVFIIASIVVPESVKKITGK